MSEWQPIESAPKDGTEILVWSKIGGGKHKFATWESDKYAKNPRPYWRMGNQNLDGVMPQRIYQPLFWMPLPLPPESEK